LVTIDPNPLKLVAYCSDQAHSSCSRAAKMSLMKCRTIDSGDDARLKPEALIAQMRTDYENGLIPAFVVITLGTTGLCAFDDLAGCGAAIRAFEVENNLKIWIHVDAAYGGPLFWIEEKRHLLNGIEHVDSFNTNLAKVGLAGFDSSPMWIRNRSDLTNSFVEDPDYLRGHENEFDEQDYQVNLRNWTVPFGRKFRAIRVWLTMKWFGKTGLQASSSKHHELALHFAARVEASEKFKIIFPVQWGLVCFQLKQGDNSLHEQIASDLKRQHGVVMTTSLWRGEVYLRATFNPLTSSIERADRVFDLIEQTALLCGDVQ